MGQIVELRIDISSTFVLDLVTTHHVIFKLGLCQLKTLQSLLEGFLYKNWFYSYILKCMVLKCIKYYLRFTHTKGILEPLTFSMLEQISYHRPPSAAHCI